MVRRRGIWKREHVRSGFELRIRENLQNELGIRFQYEDRKYKYVKECTYTPDFNFYARDSGEYLFTVEAKGLWKSEDRQKLLNVRKTNPELDLRILFQRDQPIRKGSKTLYSDFCRKNGIKYHVGETLPIEWLRDANQ